MLSVLVHLRYGALCFQQIALSGILFCFVSPVFIIELPQQERNLFFVFFIAKKKKNGGTGT
jgi:hypothetical protein